MKYYFILLLISLFGVPLSFSQNLQEFVVTKTDNTQKFFEDCRGEGTLVFYSLIPNVRFSFTQNLDRLISVSDYDEANNCYVLCVRPTDEGIGEVGQYHIKIVAQGYKPAEAFPVSRVKAREPQYFKINPRGDADDVRERRAQYQIVASYPSFDIVRKESKWGAIDVHGIVSIELSSRQEINIAKYCKI